MQNHYVHRGQKRGPTFLLETSIGNGFIHIAILDMTPSSNYIRKDLSYITIHIFNISILGGYYAYMQAFFLMHSGSFRNIMTIDSKLAHAFLERTQLHFLTFSLFVLPFSNNDL